MNNFYAFYVQNIKYDIEAVKEDLQEFYNTDDITDFDIDIELKAINKPYIVCVTDIEDINDSEEVIEKIKEKLNRYAPHHIVDFVSINLEDVFFTTRPTTIIF